MATIIINKRRDPIILSNDRAEKIKADWLNPRTDKEAIVDLGPWTGSWREIKSIEIERDVQSHHIPIEDIGKEDMRRMEEFALVKPEVKAEMLSEFVVNYQRKNGFKRPSLEVLKLAHDRQLQYYKANPTAQFVPKDYYEDLLA